MLKPGEIVTSACYQEQMIKLSDAFEAKRPFTGSGTRQVIFLQDNAPLHTTKATIEVISNLGILPHVAYSPDLAPFEYYLFRSLQHHLSDSHFRSPEEVSERWEKCTESEGNFEYFEKY